MSEKLSAHYKSMWKTASGQFKSGICDIDPLIASKDDQRRGITLLARPEREIAAEILDFQNELKKLEAHQYHQPHTDLHLTVLSIISCDDKFELNQIESQAYQNLILNCLTEPITVRLEGITASPSGVLIQGFPEGEGLENLRNELRNKFKSSSLQHSIDSRYKINTAHLTIMRFRQPLANSKEFVKVLDRYRDYAFGMMQISQLHLVFNDWYQRADIVKDLATFELA